MRYILPETFVYSNSSRGDVAGNLKAAAQLSNQGYNILLTREVFTEATCISNNFQRKEFIEFILSMPNLRLLSDECLRTCRNNTWPIASARELLPHLSYLKVAGFDAEIHEYTSPVSPEFKDFAINIADGDTQLVIDYKNHLESNSMLDSLNSLGGDYDRACGDVSELYLKRPYQPALLRRNKEHDRFKKNTSILRNTSIYDSVFDRNPFEESAVLTYFDMITCITGISHAPLIEKIYCNSSTMSQFFFNVQCLREISIIDELNSGCRLEVVLSYLDGAGCFPLPVYETVFELLKSLAIEDRGRSVNSKKTYSKGNAVDIWHCAMIHFVDTLVADRNMTHHMGLYAKKNGGLHGNLVRATSFIQLQEEVTP